MNKKQPYNTEQIRAQFPYLETDPTPIYLDNAATTQMPDSVIFDTVDFMKHHRANVSRGSHKMTQYATKAMEGVRTKVAQFIFAKSDQEIIFTRNTTESLNLAAHVVFPLLDDGDNILLTQLEHHSNLLPWEKMQEEKSVSLHYIPVDENGALKYHNLHETIDLTKIKVASFSYISNTLGTINPVRKIVEYLKSHNPNMIIILDAAQAAGHIGINLDHLKVDMLAFSAHKMYGPTGAGVLYAKQDLLKNATPSMVGGGMVTNVSYENYDQARAPKKFEAGTPAIESIIGLGSAIDWLHKIKFENLRAHELDLLEYFLNAIFEAKIEDIHIYGFNDIRSEKERNAHAGLVSFNIHGIEAEDLANYLDDDGIMVRSGHHCTMPLHEEVLETHGSVRISFGPYNTREEIDSLIESLKRAVGMLR